jgi:hypothetical protein
LPYSEGGGEEDLKARADAGINARNDLRRIGQRHLRAQIRDNFHCSDYSIIDGAGRSPRYLLTLLFKSAAAKAAYANDPLHFILIAYDCVMATCEDLGWKMAACEEFQQKYHVAYNDADPRGIENTKQRHCFVNIVAAQPVRIWQDAFYNVSKKVLNVKIRKEIRGNNLGSGAWTPISLAKSEKTNRRKNLIFVRGVKRDPNSMKRAEYLYHLNCTLVAGALLGKQASDICTDVLNQHCKAPSIPPIPSAKKQGHTSVKQSLAEKVLKQAKDLLESNEDAANVDPTDSVAGPNAEFHAYRENKNRLRREEEAKMDAEEERQAVLRKLIEKQLADDKAAKANKDKMELERVAAELKRIEEERSNLQLLEDRLEKENQNKKELERVAEEMNKLKNIAEQKRIEEERSNLQQIEDERLAKESAEMKASKKSLDYTAKMLLQFGGNDDTLGALTKSGPDINVKTGTIMVCPNCEARTHPCLRCLCAPCFELFKMESEKDNIVSKGTKRKRSLRKSKLSTNKSECDHDSMESYRQADLSFFIGSWANKIRANDSDNHLPISCDSCKGNFV